MTIVDDDIPIRGMNVDELISTKLYKGHLKQIRDIGTRHVWYDFTPQQIGELYIKLSICMKNGVLYGLEFRLVHNEPQGSDPWKNWSQDTENRLKEQQDRFLEGLFNRPPDDTTAPYKTEFNFPWGTVWSVYDAKGGVSSIGLRYSDTKVS